MTHTPGPWWIFLNDDTNEIEGEYPGIESETGSIVCFGDSSDYAGVRGDNYEQRIVDAHLIAAAPCLLEALERLYEGIDSCVALTPECLAKARAAIARARGDA